MRWLLVIFFVVCAGKEVSWGQRILDLRTPDPLASINVQDEITLHNIGSISIFSNLFFLFAVGFFVALPQLTARSPAARRRAQAARIPVPDRWASRVFFVALAIWFLVDVRFGTLGFHPYSVYPGDHYTQMDDEVFELMAAYAFMSFALLDGDGIRVAA